jgi:hypothetical protein
MQTLTWPVQKERKVYNTILSDDQSRGVFVGVLDEIAKRAEKKENLTFDATEMAAATGHDAQKVDETLRYMFNLRGFRTSEPYLLRSDDKFKVDPERFEKERVEKLKAKYETLAQQKKIEGIVGKNTDIDSKRAEELGKTLDSLKALHKKSGMSYRWQECLASYEVLKQRQGRNPDEKEVARFMGLGEPRLKGRNWLEKIKDGGYEMQFSQHVNPLIARKNVKKQKVQEAYNKLKESSKIVTINDIAEETSLSEQMIYKYSKELGLSTGNQKKKVKADRIEKIKTAYQKLNSDYPPTIEELSKESGVPWEYIRKESRPLKLSLLNKIHLNKRKLLQICKNLQTQGVKTEDLTVDELKKYTDKELPMCHNSLEHLRKKLEDEKKLPISKSRMFKENRPKYKAAYLEIVKRKQDAGQKIRYVDVAKEMAVKLGEEIPDNWPTQLRDETGMPKKVDNNVRYANIISVYKQRPGIGMDEWAQKAHVSFGFLYNTIRKLGDDPHMLDKFKPPRDMAERVPIRDSQEVLDFKALGNTNRLNILKAIGCRSSLTLDEVVEELGYSKAKWGDTIGYHCDVLKRAGMIVESGGRLDLSEKAENLLPAIEAWDPEKIVPEDIFGTGYNKSLFASAIAGDRKSLKDIIAIMRQEKGAVPLVVPAMRSAERHPIHSDSKERKERFKKYLEPDDGTYGIKEEYAGVIVPLIEKVWESQDKKPRKSMPIHPHYLAGEISKRGLDYIKIRRMVEQLLHGEAIYPANISDNDEKALVYMNFIKDNIVPICRKLKRSPLNIALTYDRNEETYVLKAR